MTSYRALEDKWGLLAAGCSLKLFWWVHVCVCFSFSPKYIDITSAAMDAILHVGRQLCFARESRRKVKLYRQVELSWQLPKIHYLFIFFWVKVSCRVLLWKKKWNGLQSDFELQTACELVCSEELLLILTLGQSIGGAVKYCERLKPLTVVVERPSRLDLQPEGGSRAVSVLIVTGNPRFGVRA